MSIVLADKVFPEIAAWGDELTAIRREIHSHPELGFDTAVTVRVRPWLCVPTLMRSR